MAFIISWISVALFDISMLSGLIVAFVYKPSIAYESVQKLTYLIPYGNVFRELHYFSSEAFLVFVCLHVALELAKLSIKIDLTSWNYSVISLIVLLMLMFTGYVLKADLSGLSAGQVALSLMKQTPFVDTFLPLLEDNTLFIWKFYIWHILFLPLILTYAIYKHITLLQTKYFIVGLGITILLMMVYVMPKDIAFDVDAQNVDGPWFFLGAENLLVKGISPLIVDLVIIFPFCLLFAFYFVKDKRPINYLLVLWLGAYAYFTFI